MALPAHLQLSTRPLAPQASVITGEGWRVTVLTEHLLRLEYSATNTFEDRATQAVLNREFPTPEFTAVRKGAGVQVRTAALTLDYDGLPFGEGVLHVTPSGGEGHRQVWRYGDSNDTPWETPINLLGTTRTLDVVDGATALDLGIMSSLGTAHLDDTASLALTEDGWVAPHASDVDLYVFSYGYDYDAALRAFYTLTGPTPMLPRYALGNWWSRYHAYTTDSYLALLDRFEAERLPFSVAVLDMDWHEVDIPARFGSGWTGYTWNRALIPDPEALLAEIHRRGMAVTLNVHPADGVRGHEDVYPAMARARGIDPETEEPVTFDIGDPSFAEPYLSVVHHPLEEQGVDFWWVDWQQGTQSAVRGLDPLWMLNHLHFLDAGRDGRRPLILSRYAGPGSHRYPVGFSGDTVMSWASLDFQPYFTATAANIGYGWWSHDIGGHLWGYRDEELTTRWVQLGCFSPINRLHTSSSRFAVKEPWLFDRVHSVVMSEFLRLRHRLLPYLYTMNERAHRLGEPLVRPLYYADLRPESINESKNTFLFGTQLVVAPITAPNDRSTGHGVVRTWLPEGSWVDLFTGLRYDGGRLLQLHRSIEALPVLAKAGAIVPLTFEDVQGVANPDALELIVVAGADGEFELYEDDDALHPRSVRTRFTWSDAAQRLQIHPAEGDLDVVPASRAYRVRVIGLTDGDQRPLPDVPEPRFGRPVDAVTVEIGDVATASGTVLQVDGERVGNRELDRIESVLRWTQMGTNLKETLWHRLSLEPSLGRRMMVLDALDLAPALRGVLTEILLADPES